MIDYEVSRHDIAQWRGLRQDVMRSEPMCALIRPVDFQKNILPMLIVGRLTDVQPRPGSQGNPPQVSMALNGNLHFELAPGDILRVFRSPDRIDLDLDFMGEDSGVLGVRLNEPLDPDLIQEAIDSIQHELG